MEKKVSRIRPVSDPGTTYFLQIAWAKNISAGFDVMLSDSLSVWTGRVPEEEISREATDMEMEREKYVEELRKVLLSEGRLTDKYSFDISKEGVNEESLRFSYEKNLKDVSFKLGSLNLQKVSRPSEAIRELISYCLDCIVELHDKNGHLQKENDRLLSDLEDMQGQLQKCVEAKEELEADLYQRFILVLNEKKAKIRSLQNSLKEAEETIEKTSQIRDTVASSESKVEIEDYEASTDEESENVAESSTIVPVAKPRRDSLLSPDLTDIAPSRKRRQRVRKAAGVEPKVALYEAQVPAKKKLDPAQPKSSAECKSSKGISLETEKNTGDPEDLFDDL
ncbi:DNA repair protein XRCC4 [Tiliqua scincoides]|uniref:DNA repair protein XRCC4 n=1 Tax=Tiliqua scincoides TaxID=71010 RepID=UPI003461CBE4